MAVLLVHCTSARGSTGVQDSSWHLNTLYVSNLGLRASEAGSQRLMRAEACHDDRFQIALQIVVQASEVQHRKMASPFTSEIERLASGLVALQVNLQLSCEHSCINAWMLRRNSGKDDCGRRWQ